MIGLLCSRLTYVSIHVMSLSKIFLLSGIFLLSSLNVSCEQKVPNACVKQLDMKRCFKSDDKYCCFGDEHQQDCCPLADWSKLSEAIMAQEEGPEVLQSLFDLKIYLPYFRLWYVKVLLTVVLVISVTWFCCLCDFVQNILAKRRKRAKNSTHVPVRNNTEDKQGAGLPEDIDKRTTTLNSSDTSLGPIADVKMPKVSSALSCIEEEGSCYSTISAPASLRLAYYSHPLNFATVPIQLKDVNSVGTLSISENNNEVTNKSLYVDV